MRIFTIGSLDVDVAMNRAIRIIKKSSLASYGSEILTFTPTLSKNIAIYNCL